MLLLTISMLLLTISMLLLTISMLLLTISMLLLTKLKYHGTLSFIILFIGINLNMAVIINPREVRKDMAYRMPYEEVKRRWIDKTLKFPEWQRKPKSKGISKLTKSIIDNGFKIENHIEVKCYKHVFSDEKSPENDTFVINKNDDLIVIDGQHRLLAALDAKSYVWFMVSNKTREQVRECNNSQSRWSHYDRLFSFCRDDNCKDKNAYIRFSRLIKKYHFTPNEAFILMGWTDGSNNPLLNKWIKGKFNLNDAMLESRMILINLLKDSVDSEFKKSIKTRHFLSAFISVHNKYNGFNFKLLSEKIKHTKAGKKFTFCTSVHKYECLIIYLWNYGRTTNKLEMPNDQNWSPDNQ